MSKFGGREGPAQIFCPLYILGQFGDGETPAQIFWHIGVKKKVQVVQIRRRGAPCIGGRTISFLVKFESSVFLMNRKADFGFKVLKKWTSKTEKMRKCLKTANFGHVLVYLSG